MNLVQNVEEIDYQLKVKESNNLGDQESKPVGTRVALPSTLIDYEVPLESNPLAQTDPKLVELVRDSNLIIPPSKLPYNLSEPSRQQSQGQTQVVDILFKDEVDVCQATGKLTYWLI